MPTTMTDIANGDIDNTSKTFFSDLLARIEVLEAAPAGAQVFPDSVVENYPDGTKVTYNKA